MKNNANTSDLMTLSYSLLYLIDDSQKYNHHAINPMIVWKYLMVDHGTH